MNDAKTIHELDAAVRSKAECAFAQGHGLGADFSIPADRAWIEGYAYALATQPQATAPAAVAGPKEAVAAPTTQAAPRQSAQEPCPTCVALARTVMFDQVSFDRKPDCYGIRKITDDESVEEWEDIRTSPDVAREEANDMMATGRGVSIHARHR